MEHWILSQREHDFDKNFKLDGLELMAALSHVFQHGDGDEAEGEEDEGLTADQLPLIVGEKLWLQYF